MKRLSLLLPLLAAALLSGCVYGRAARKCLNEPWTGLEIRRRDSFVNPTYDPNRRIHLTEEAKTRKEPLPTIVVVEPDALRDIRQAFPSGNLEPSFKPGVLLNFECVATTESGETVSLWFFDGLTKGPESSAGTLSVSVSPEGDFHCKGPAADRFFENLWRVCRQRGLFEGSFSDFVVTADDTRRLFAERIHERDIRLERKWNDLFQADPATRSPAASESHAENAEGAETVPHASPSSFPSSPQLPQRAAPGSRKNTLPSFRIPSARTPPPPDRRGDAMKIT